MNNKKLNLLKFMISIELILPPVNTLWVNVSDFAQFYHFRINGYNQ